MPLGEDPAIPPEHGPAPGHADPLDPSGDGGPELRAGDHDGAGAPPPKEMPHAVDTDRIVKSAQKYGPTGVANARALQQMMATLAGKDDAAKIKAVNDFYNQRLAYMEDIDNWGVQDYWASPLEALGKGAGDCEDYAIGKYFTLTSLGIPHSRLRMVYVRASIAGAPNGYVAHMVLRNIDFYARTERPDTAAQHLAYGELLLSAVSGSRV